jgi:hypothetical protein
VFSSRYSFSWDYSPNVGQFPPIRPGVILGSRQQSKALVESNPHTGNRTSPAPDLWPLISNFWGYAASPPAPFSPQPLQNTPQIPPDELQRIKRIRRTIIS